MVQIESLKNYLSKQEFAALVQKIYQMTAAVSAHYPHYQDWFFHQQLPGLTKGERNLLFVRHPQLRDEVIAVSALKKTVEERKLCTLYVDEKFRGQGIGTVLIEKSLQWLGTTKPLVTFAADKLPMFQPLIEKYGWQLKQTITDSYDQSAEELCFNGVLTAERTVATQKRGTLVGFPRQDQTPELTR